MFTKRPQLGQGEIKLKIINNKIQEQLFLQIKQPRVKLVKSAVIINLSSQIQEAWKESKQENKQARYPQIKSICNKAHQISIIIINNLMKKIKKLTKIFINNTTVVIILIQQMKLNRFKNKYDSILILFIYIILIMS